METKFDLKHLMISDDLCNKTNMLLINKNTVVFI